MMSVICDHHLRILVHVTIMHLRLCNDSKRSAKTDVDMCTAGREIVPESQVFYKVRYLNTRSADVTMQT